MEERVDAAVVDLARWAGASKVDAAIDRRRREQVLRRQAEDEATLANLLGGMVERRTAVTLSTQTGAVHRGVLVGVGIDYVAVAGDTHLTLIQLAAVDTLRPAEPGDPAAFGDRAATAGRLASVLSGMADDHRDVTVVTASGAITGELLAVGDDVVTLRPSGAERGEVVYVPVASVSEASLRLSG